MDELLQTQINESRQNISILKNPFEKSCITQVATWIQRDIWKENVWKFWGKVEFKNGNTEGQQRFDADTFTDLLKQIEEFIKSLDQPKQ